MPATLPEQEEAPPAALGGHIPEPFAAWRHRDYRFLITGQGIATLGRQMQTVAITYQVYQLHHSTLELGALGLVQLIPALAFGLVGGVLADRVDRRHLLLVTQPAQLGCALALALATFAGWANLAVIFAITALAATISTINEPAREALLPALVPREDIANAISWDITLSKVASIAGPALGGLAIGAFGLAGTYAIEAGCLVAVLGAVLGLRARLGAAAPDGPQGWHAALEGLRFVRRNDLLLGIMSLDFLANFWGSATVLLPVLADRVFNVGPTVLGFLFAASAVGSVIGAAGLTAVAHRVRQPGWALLGALAVYGLATVGLGLSRTLPAAFVALAAIGLADTIGMAFRSQILQLATPNALRGRVTAAEQLFTGGGPQAGQIEAGAVAARFGAPFAIASGGVACLLSVVLIAWLIPSIRRYGHEEVSLETEIT
jgi:MFS family permease